MLLRWSSLWHTEGGVGGMGGRRMNVLWTALEERHCDGEDVVALKMLLCWRCCFVEDLENVATLKMLLRWRCWRCCYVEDVVTFRMLLLWRCFYVENVEDVAILKKGDVLFAHGSPGNYDISMGSMKTLKFYQHAVLLVSTKQHKMKNLKNTKLVSTTDSIPGVCCPRVEVVQCVFMYHEDHKTL
jgi:hypothetical protein